MKQKNKKAALTSTKAILIYVIAVFCLIVGLRQPAFFSPATIITTLRASIFWMCFALSEMIVILSGGIDVSFPAIGCAAMYIPMYMINQVNHIDNAAYAFVLAILIGTVVGLLLGICAALNRGKFLDGFCTVFSIIGVCVPSYVFLIFLQYYFSYKIPFFPYFREARRIAGRDTMTVEAARHPYDFDLYTRAVAVGDYPVDHHHVQNPRRAELAHLWFGEIPSFSVPLGVVIPVQVEDLLVADKAISVTWEMNGGTRLQPVIMGLGQAAGALAALSVRHGKHPSEIPVRDVQDLLLDHGCYLLPFLDLKPGDPGFRQLQEDGINGLVRGQGRSVGWSNETWVNPPAAD